jgi:hypothetical protein
MQKWVTARVASFYGLNVFNGWNDLNRKSNAPALDFFALMGQIIDQEIFS